MSVEIRPTDPVGELKSPTGGRPLEELWRFRDLLKLLVSRNLKVKYQRSVLGFIWTLLNPLLSILVLYVVFSHVVRLPIDHYWAFLFSGYFAWNFTSQAINAGTLVLAEHTVMLRSVTFPAEITVIAATVSRLLEFAIELTLIFVLLAIFHHGALPASFLVAPLIVTLQLLVLLGLILPVAAMSVFYYDVRHLLPPVVQVLFYVTPVFYTLDLVPEPLRPLYYLNPIAGLMQLYHVTLYDGRFPSATLLGALSAAALLVCLIGYGIFRHYRPLLAEVV